MAETLIINLLHQQWRNNQLSDTEGIQQHKVLKL